MKKRIMSMLMAVIMLLGVFPITALADDMPFSISVDGSVCEMSNLDEHDAYKISIPEGKSITVSGSAEWFMMAIYDVANTIFEYVDQEQPLEITLTAEDIERFVLEDTSFYEGTFAEGNRIAAMFVFSGEMQFNVLIELVSAESSTVAVESISLDKTALELEVEGTATLEAKVLPENATDKTVTWTSDNESVARVENGVVTAVAEGKANITAKAGEQTATCEVTVKAKTVTVTEITLSAESAQLEVGENTTLSANVLPENATDKTVTWTSDNESVAKVENGVVTAVAEGKANITAKAGEQTATCAIDVFAKGEKPYEVTVKVAPATAKVTFYSDKEVKNPLDAQQVEEKVVDGVLTYVLKVKEGTYYYRATDGDQNLGGMSFKVPFEEEILNNGAGGGVSSGKGLTLTLSRVNAYTTNTNIDEIGDYTIHYYPAELDEPVNGTQYIDDSGRVVTPTMLVCRGNALAYQISFDVSEKIADLGYTISSIANATYADNASVKSQTFALEKTSVYEITAPAAAKVQMFDQLNNFNVMEIKENSKVTNEDGTVTHKFVSHGANSITYRVSMEGKITRAGYPNYFNGPKNITVEFEENENPKTTENVMDKANMQNRAESSTLVNVNAQNNLSIDVGETFRLRSFRGAWQIINSDTENIMIEPDFNYNIISGGEHIELSPVTSRCTGNAGAGMQSNWMEIKGLSKGIAVIEVSYDAIKIYDDSHGGLFGATDPNRKSLVVIEVGGSDKNVTITEDGADFTWDTEFDTVYFLGDTGSMTFTTDIEVDKAELSVDNGKTWKEISAKDGKYTAEGLVSGNNIIRFTVGTDTCYQVVRAAKITYSLTNKSRATDAIIAGDTIELVFEGVYNPISKMSGIYNPGFGDPERVMYKAPAEATVTSTGAQYSFVTANKYTIKTSTAGEYKFTDGYVYVTAMGDGAGSHRNLTDAGRGTNMSASKNTGARCVMPDLVFNVIEMPNIELKVNTDEGTAVVVKDVEGNIITPENGVYKVKLGSYSIEISKNGYVTERQSFEVGAADIEGKTLDIALRKVEGDIWDGKTKTEPKKNEDGYYKIYTGAELAWFAAKVNGGGNESICAILMDDISLGGFNWTPIGTQSSGKYFKGVLDGNGHNITDLYINATTKNQGLIGYASGTCTVKNLAVYGSVNTTAESAAGIIGCAAGKTVLVENCANFASVTVDLSKLTNSNMYVGGIIGYSMNYSTIKNCYNRGNITVTAPEKDKSNGAAGINGSAHSNKATVIENNYNTGVITVLNPTKKSKSEPILLPPPSGNYTAAVNNYYLNGTSSGEVKTGTGVTSAKLKTLAKTLGSAYKEDGNCIQINDGYPVLSWQKVIDHEFDSVTYTWAEDGSKCTAKAVCKNNSNHVITATASGDAITSVITEKATCSVKGKTEYTATFEESWAGTDTTEIQDVAIDPDAHEWSEEVTYSWEKVDGKWTCTAEVVCKNDSKHVLTATASGDAITSVVTEKATCSVKGKTEYTATFEESWAGTAVTEIQDVAIDSDAHEWSEEVTYSWEKVDDEWTCTAKSVCSYDDTHKRTSKATISESVKVEPTCTEMGTTTYTANFEVDWAKTQEKDVEDIPDTGHDLEFVEERRPTYYSKGHESYYRCKNCTKYFKDAKGTIEITYADVVIPRLEKKQTVTISLNGSKNDGEENPNTGAPVYSMVPAMSLVITSICSAAFILKKK